MEIDEAAPPSVTLGVHLEILAVSAERLAEGVGPLPLAL